MVRGPSDPVLLAALEGWCDASSTSPLLPAFAGEPGADRELRFAAAKWLIRRMSATSRTRRLYRGIATVDPGPDLVLSSWTGDRATASLFADLFGAGTVRMGVIEERDILAELVHPDGTLEFVVYHAWGAATRP